MKSCISSTVASLSWINGTLMEYPFSDQYSDELFYHDIPYSLNKSAQFRPLLDESRKLVGCWIAKAGSRELIKTFDDLTKFKPNNINAAKYAMKNPNFKRIVVVRDPLIRVVSSYIDKYSWLYPNYEYSVPSFKLKQFFDGKYITWEDYLKVTNQSATLKLLLDKLDVDEEGELKTRDIHLLPQARLCHLHQIRYDYVMELKNIQSGFLNLKKREKIDLPMVLISFSHYRLRNHKNYAFKRICNHVDASVEQKIREVFKIDYQVFEAFGMKNLIYNVTELCKDYKELILEG